MQLEYYRLGRRDDFRVILERTQQADVSSELRDAHHEAIRVINCLAWHFITLANGEHDAQAREDALHEVSKWTNRANRMEGHVLTSTAMAMGYLVQGKTDQVEIHLDLAKDREMNAATMLVRATLHYAKGEYSDALALFGRVLRAKPDCSAQVRFGLGMCYFKLERRDMAERCFVRALELNVQLVEPRVALAILKLNTGDLAQVQPAMKLLQEAYRIDDTHPRVLNFLADHFLHRREFDKGVKLAERARSDADVDRIFAESEYHLARAAHAQGDFARAQTHYESAVQKDPSNVLAQLGLAQALLHYGHTDRALACLETVLHRYPDDVATLQIMGTLHARKGHVEARELLQRAIDVDSKDPEVLIEFAELMESADRSKSLRAYRAALKLLAERGKESPERMRNLQNNVAVMLHRLGQFTQAQEAYEAVFAAQGATTAAARVDVSVTSSFNFARLFEDTGKFDEARAQYEAILAKHVTYTDCYLRLATMARQEGRTDEALRQLNLALTVHEDLPDALAMMGLVHLESNEFHAAQLKFTRVLERVNQNDPYALLALGNIYYMARADKKERKERNMKHAAESFWRG
jgi:RNA polymerase-associated protein CTR9